MPHNTDMTGPERTVLSSQSGQGTDNVARRGAILVLLVLFAGVLLVRWPFISNILVGEEGYFAVLSVHDGLTEFPHTGQYHLFGRIDGKPIFAAPEHPAPPFLFLVRVLRPVFRPAHFDQLTLESKTRWARAPYLLCFCCGLLSLAVITINGLSQAHRTGYVIVLCALGLGLVNPLVVGSSIQPQLDGGIGVLFMTLTAALIHFSDRNGRPGLMMLTLIGAGLITGLGKNEWGLALLGGLLLAMGLLLMDRLITRTDRPLSDLPWKHFSLIVLGLLVGNLLSWLVDPWNYVHGLAVMKRYGGSSIMTHAQVWNLRLPWIWPLLLLLTLTIIIIVRGWPALLRGRFTSLVLFTWALCLSGGFLLSRWSGDGFPRYFCPVIMVLLCAWSSFLPHIRWRWPTTLAMVLILAVGMTLAGLSLVQTWREQRTLGSTPGLSLRKQEHILARTLERSILKNRPIRADFTFGYYYPEREFVARSLSPEQAKRVLSGQSPILVGPGKKFSKFRANDTSYLEDKHDFLY